MEVENNNWIQIGEVSRIYPKANVAAIVLSDSLKVGDTIKFDEAGIERAVESMQIDRQDVSEAGSGDHVGILVPGIDDKTVKEGEIVYKQS